MLRVLRCVYSALSTCATASLSGILVVTRKPRFLAGTLLVLLPAGTLAAHLVIMKDGFTLKGLVKQETTSFVDPASGQQIPVPKTDSPTKVKIDDGARRIILSRTHVKDAFPDPGGDKDLVALERRFVRLDRFRMPSGQYAGFGPWDDKWDRVVKLDSSRGRIEIAQHLSILTPYFARIDARRYNWSPHYLMRELDPETVLPLVRQHPDVKSAKKGDAVARRFRVFHFEIQAGWYDQALTELDGILKDFPGEKEKVETARTQLKKLVLARFVDRIEQANRVGRHQWAQARLASLPQQDLDDKLLLRIRALEATYETVGKSLSLARRLLAELPPRVADTNLRELFVEAAKAIDDELCPDNVSRLDSFLKLAEFNKDRDEHPPEQLLSLAVSGWLLGNRAAENKVEAAVRLWKTRRFVLEYQKTHDLAARQHMLSTYQRDAGIEFDELAQLAGFLPPPEPLQMQLDVGPGGVGNLPFFPAATFLALSTVQKYMPVPQFELQPSLPWNFRKSATYFVRLPPEYHAGRSYPVLFVLHEGGQKPEDMLKRWGELAALNGYFLVAPEWERSIRHRYEYSTQEHAAVVDVLRDLQRHFQIDSDRVFLAGFGEGGNMAYDVGLSHPDLFAGVLPMGAGPRYFAKSYWQNGQYLPFYVVGGDMDGEGAKDNARQFEQWIAHGYPAVYVEYKGRGREWFEGELLNSFDWMGRKKRSGAFPELGRTGTGKLFGDEFQSMRPTDNRFYWLAGQDLNERHTNNAENWNSQTAAASLAARIADGNQINVTARGFRRVTVWFGQGMIDWNKPVSFNVNLRPALSNRKIVPNVETLLEDLYLRGDKQRIFWAKIELGV
jgi:pimeloyl-ACP methyl ester carboxylesterase